jgi:hypothetical protein
LTAFFDGFRLPWVVIGLIVAPHKDKLDADLLEFISA